MYIMFWISFALLVYHIVLYPILIKIMSLFSKELPIVELSEFPTVTIICPAYNEEDSIATKLDSFINLDYPKDKVKIIVISDDSEDNTNTIVEDYSEQYQNIELRVQKPRRGKPSGHNMVEPTLDTDYVFSTDANSIFDSQCLKHLVRKMISNPQNGLVAGQLKYVSNGVSGSGEGLYWKYENSIRSSESKVRSINGAPGSIFLVKRELFTQIHPASVDDFERTLIVLENNCKAVYEPKAFVEEEVTETSKDEFKRKVRIISREWFVVHRHIVLFNPFKYPFESFTLVSHKILRWLFFVFTSLFFIANIFLAIKLSIFFIVVMGLQILFYALGLIDLKVSSNSSVKKLTKMPGYFVLMYLSSILAFNKFLKGEQATTWSTIRS